MALELPSIEDQQRFSLSDLEGLATFSPSMTFSPSLPNADVFNFEPLQTVVSDDTIQPASIDSSIDSQAVAANFSEELDLSDISMLPTDQLVLEGTDFQALAETSPSVPPLIMNSSSHASNPNSPPQVSEEDSGNASDGSSVYDPSAGEEIPLNLKVPRAKKRELQNRPFAKRSKPNFHEDMTEEERRLIEKEGFRFPGNRCLTKAEEKQLKKLRRKVKNKISAQDSRKRRKQYVEDLENNVRTAASANQNLRHRVTSLEKENQSLLEQLKQMQAQLRGALSGSASSAGTALMILGLCFSMFVSPDVLNTSTTSSTAGLPSFSVDGSLSTTRQSRTLSSVPEVDLPGWNGKRGLPTQDGATGWIQELGQKDVLDEALQQAVASLNVGDQDRTEENTTQFDQEDQNVDLFDNSLKHAAVPDAAFDIEVPSSL